MMLRLVDLLKRGYFPKKLPPPCRTETFGSLLEDQPSLIACLSSESLSTRPARHSLSRAGNLRRLLSVPNPLPYLKLANWLEENWTDVEAQCHKSSISLSKPCISQTGRAVVAEVPFNRQPLHQAALRASAKYILKTDITNFYPSIYTHSISWALHTKQKAKSQRGSPKLLGNQLDKIVRQGQDGQSIGIPIGPDTSFIIAELLLSSIDEDFCTKIEETGLRAKGYRSYDDFEIGFTSRTDAENAIAMLEGVLSEYELQLNPNKTTIVELPIPVEPSWVSELRLYNLDRRSQSWKLRGYFDRAFELSRLNPDAEVLKYAIQRLRSVNIDKDNWTLCQDLLLQCAMVEASALPVVIDHLHFYKQQDYPLDLDKVTEVFNILIGSHAALEHGSEVAWILWACLLFDLTIEDFQAYAIADMEDPFVALLMLHAQDSGLTQNKIEFENWKTALTQQGLYDSQWVLSYEANQKEWISVRDAYISSDSVFGILKRNDVSFYDASVVKSHTPSERYEIFVGGVGTYSEEHSFAEKASVDENDGTA